MNANWEEIEFELERRSALICELQSQLAALQWRPITEQDFPKVGDEVLRFMGDGDMAIYRVIFDWTYLHHKGYVRLLNAPPADKASA